MSGCPVLLQLQASVLGLVSNRVRRVIVDERLFPGHKQAETRGVPLPPHGQRHHLPRVGGCPRVREATREVRDRRLALVERCARRARSGRRRATPRTEGASGLNRRNAGRGDRRRMRNSTRRRRQRTSTKLSARTRTRTAETIDEAMRTRSAPWIELDKERVPSVVLEVATRSERAVLARESPDPSPARQRRRKPP